MKKRYYQVERLSYFRRISELSFSMLSGVILFLYLYYVDGRIFLLLVALSSLALSIFLLKPSNDKLDKMMIDIGKLNSIKQWASEIPELSDTVKQYIIDSNGISEYGYIMIKNKYYELLNIKNENNKQSIINEFSTKT